MYQHRIRIDMPTEFEKGRTSGDGMEENKFEKPENIKISDEDRYTNLMSKKESVHRQKSLNNKVAEAATYSILSNNTYGRTGISSRSLAPIVPNGELVEMKPRLVKSQALSRGHKKQRSPKFIPFEPYPGAVNSITKNCTHWQAKTRVLKRNNLDIGILANQMSKMRNNEMKMKSKTDQLKEINYEEFQTLQDQKRKLTEERNYFQNQFKFQLQVNSELKNLLVASVGEDLQTHVNLLTEDKLQLARALLDTANHITTHTEQIEFLASQCEVWRSKFLASSVMVEELARWKADLTQKNKTLNESAKGLLQSFEQIRKMQFEILKNLKFLAKIRYLNLPALDAITLSAENLNILQQMVLHSGVGIPELNLSIVSASSNSLCEAELCAVQALQLISPPLKATDEAIRALFEQAKSPLNASEFSGVLRSFSSSLNLSSNNDNNTK